MHAACMVVGVDISVNSGGRGPDWRMLSGAAQTSETHSCAGRQHPTATDVLVGAMARRRAQLSQATPACRRSIRRHPARRRHRCAAPRIRRAGPARRRGKMRASGLPTRRAGSHGGLKLARCLTGRRRRYRWTAPRAGSAPPARAGSASSNRVTLALVPENLKAGSANAGSSCRPAAAAGGWPRGGWRPGRAGQLRFAPATRSGAPAGRCRRRRQRGGARAWWSSQSRRRVGARAGW